MRSLRRKLILRSRGLFDVEKWVVGIAIKYRFGQEQFLNANFVRNQYEVPQNSRYAKRFCDISML